MDKELQDNPPKDSNFHTLAPSCTLFKEAVSKIERIEDNSPISQSFKFLQKLKFQTKSNEEDREQSNNNQLPEKQT